MTSIWVTYQEKYDQPPVSAEALFFHSALHDKVKGLRVLVSDLDLEFTDNSYIGTDPAGLFYYDDIEVAKTANKYVSDTTRNPVDNQLIAWVKFYKDDTLVAEFIGNDFFNAVSVAGMVNYEHSGYWQEASAHSSVEASLTKVKNSESVTLDVSKAIGKKATMTSDDPHLKATAIAGIKGHFHYDSLAEIKNGTYVSYTNDRIVFYEDDNTGTTFTGYFIPNGRADDPNLLGVSGDTELTLSGTAWN